MTHERDVTDAADVSINGLANGTLPSDDELWSLKIVLKKTGLSRSTIYAYIACGTFPTQRRLGPRRIAWLASEVQAWIASRPPQVTA
jgi:prophage regulatory protein